MTELEDIDIEPFKELIQRDPDICNNCFENWRETHERTHAVDPDGYVRPLRNSIASIIRPTHLPKGTRAQTYTFHEPTHGTGTTCQCGSPFDPVRPISSRKMIEFLQNLEQRLEEKGVDFEEDVMYDKAREWKSQPDNQCADDTIIGAAVTMAIDHSVATRRSLQPDNNPTAAKIDHD